MGEETKDEEEEPPNEINIMNININIGNFLPISDIIFSQEKFIIYIERIPNTFYIADLQLYTQKEEKGKVPQDNS